jgi:hypothetical protein
MKTLSEWKAYALALFLGIVLFGYQNCSSPMQIADTENSVKKIPQIQNEKSNRLVIASQANCTELKMHNLILKVEKMELLCEKGGTQILKLENQELNLAEVAKNGFSVTPVKDCSTQEIRLKLAPDGSRLESVSNKTLGLNTLPSETDGLKLGLPAIVNLIGKTTYIIKLEKQDLSEMRDGSDACLLRPRLNIVSLDALTTQ